MNLRNRMNTYSHELQYSQTEDTASNTLHNIEATDAQYVVPYWLQSGSLQGPDDRSEEETHQHMNQAMNDKELKERQQGVENSLQIHYQEMIHME